MANLAKPNKSVQRKGMPPKEDEASDNMPVTEKEEKKPLNFKVPSSFRKKFKNFATNHEMPMSELLILCFEEYEKKKSI